MRIKSLYISSHTVAAGKLVVSMGMMEFLKAKVHRVAFFRPFVKEKDHDHDITFFLERYTLDMTETQTYGITVHEAEKMIAEGSVKRLMKILVTKIKELEKGYDFVLIEGLHHSAFSAAIDLDLNLEVAKNAAVPYANVLNTRSQDTLEVLDNILMDHKHIKASGCRHFATFANRLEEGSLLALRRLLEAHSELPPTYLLPEVDELDMPTIFEVRHALDCEVIRATGKTYRRVVRQTKIAAMRLENFLGYVEEGDLVLVPADRADIIIGTLLSTQSSRYPNISGILLTGDMDLAPSIRAMLESFDTLTIPILAVAGDTYRAALMVEKIPVTIRAKSERKIALAMGLFNTAVDMKELEQMLVQEESSLLTPIMFEYALFQRARTSKQRIVLPEAMDERILRAVETVLRRDVVEIILLGDSAEILQKSGTLGLDISKAEIVDLHTSPLQKRFAKTLYRLRKHKGLSLDAACDMLLSSAYFATMMVYMGYADGMVSGATHTTQETIRPALQIIKTKPDIPIVSSLFFMSFETRVLVYADCAINQDPSAQELATIAITTADTSMQFGIEPRIAMLSYSTGSSGKGADVDKVAEATRIVRERRPELPIEGPIQYDAAIDPVVAAQKLPRSEVAGRATLFIFPDLNTGNNTYKAVQRASGAVAIGPVLQGLKKPINDLSRGCLVADIINTIVITAIQAAQERS